MFPGGSQSFLLVTPGNQVKMRLIELLFRMMSASGLNWSLGPNAPRDRPSSNTTRLSRTSSFERGSRLLVFNSQFSPNERPVPQRRECCNQVHNGVPGKMCRCSNLKASPCNLSGISTTAGYPPPNLRHLLRRTLET